MTKAKKKDSPSPPKNKIPADCPPGSRLQDCAREASESQSIDKIRDIIFGNQMLDYDKRFARLEEGLQKQLKELRSENNSRLDSMEAFIKKEVDALSDRLRNEQSAREALTKKLSREIKDSATNISKNINRLEQTQSKDTREMRQQLLDLSKNISSEIRKKHGESSKALERAFKELNEDKVARTTLSELLLELAIRTSNELAQKFNLETSELKNE